MDECIIGYVIYYINNSEFTRFVLDLVTVKNDRGDTLFNAFKKMLKEYDLDGEIISVVSGIGIEIE